MAFYHTCPDCGCNLDPGEKCTCKEEKEKQLVSLTKHIKNDSRTNQLRFVFEEGLYEKAVGC